MVDLVLIPVAFALGAVSFLGPCHLAIIPIFISYLLANDNIDRRKGVLAGVLYTLGLTLTFSSYNFILSLFPETILSLPIFRISAGFIIVILALGLLIGFDFGTSKFNKSEILKSVFENFNIIGFGIFGLISGLAWIPCMTPMISVILTMISIQGEFVYGYILLCLYSFGLGLPFIVLGALGTEVKSATLARWMKYSFWIQRGLAIILLVLGILILMDGVKLYSIFN
ncbi:hypothetical protein CEE45_16075 [Candidatus Heimdallarchaeota archaeon B3_Heim]|nr:MAG: hypothetical protein CEE45_16075 [Candidatus Heimdallarchaeota archaeon B3_Heim]